MSDSQINDAFRGTADAAIAAFSQLDGTNTAVTPPTVTITPPATTPVVQATTVTPAVETPAAQAVTPSEPQILDVSPDTPVRIKVDGVEKIVKASEYQELLQRNDVITQRHQALAQQRRDLEAHYAQREAELIRQAQYVQQVQAQLQQQGDPVARLVQQLQQTQTPKQNPNEIATIGEVQQAFQAFQERQTAELARLQQESQQSAVQAREQAKQEMLLAQDQRRITETVNRILDTDDGKLLKELNPQAEAVIRFNALQMGPENVEQAIEYLNQYAKDWAGKVKGKLSQAQTGVAVAAAKTVMEPPSGQAPTLAQVQKPALKKDGTVDWNLLREQALALMD